MSRIPTKSLSVLSLTALMALGTYAPVSQAFNFGNMMNPNRWFGGNNHDRYNDDYYDEGPYGYGGGPWGGGGPYGYGAPYGGYGAPYGGYGAPGYYGAPGVAPVPAPAPAAAAPTQSSGASASASASESEIQSLKRRIEELESTRQPNQAPPSGQAQPPQSSDWPSAPAFRPMNQY